MNTINLNNTSGYIRKTAVLGRDNVELRLTWNGYDGHWMLSVGDFLHGVRVNPGRVLFRNADGILVAPDTVGKLTLNRLEWWPNVMG